MWWIIGIAALCLLMRYGHKRSSDDFVRWTDSLRDRRLRGERLDHNGEPEDAPEEVTVRVRVSLPEREQMERVVNGALRSAIHDHGPITKELIGSATKRVLGALEQLNDEQASVSLLR